MSFPDADQLSFDLPARQSFGHQDFLVSASNAAALAWIERWPDWPSGALLLHGPEGSGKTHLAHIWRVRARATAAGATPTETAVWRLLGEGNGRIVADDAERIPEEALLHLYNACLEGGGSLLLTGRRPAEAWSIVLPDLRSRLRALPAAAIGAPDDPLLSALLIKHFADRQLRVAPEVIAYLVVRMERSAAAAAAIAARLDAASLRDGRAVTVPLARRVLDGPDNQPPPAASDSGVT